MTDTPLPVVANAADYILGAPIDAGLGDAPALICGDETLSYDDLARRVARHGRALLAAGIGRDDRVLFFLDDQPDLVAGYLAAMKIGAVAIAYNIRATAEELKFALQDSAARALYIGAEFLDRYLDIAGALDNPPLVIVDAPNEAGLPTITEFIAGRDESLDSAATGPDDMAFWIYTSGTTGHPKGAVHRHQDVAVCAAHVAWCQDVGPGTRVFATSKLFFAYALGHVLFGALARGACVILMRGWPDAQKVAGVIERNRPQVVYSVPALYRNLLAEGVARQPAFHAVRLYFSAGEKLPEQLFARWWEATGKPIIEGIGSSEALILFIAGRPREHRPGSCGKTTPWAQTRLVDEAGREITAPDTPGQLQVRYPALFSHYWGRPEKTAAAFAEGWYCTGDMFTVDAEGWWTHQGRDDDMLKISGQWVSPAEVEDIARQVPGVADAAIVAITDADGLTRMALFLEAPAAAEPRKSARLVTAVRGRLDENLAVYKRPRIIRVVREMPRTATGKLQRFKLRQALLQDDPARSGAE